MGSSFNSAVYIPEQWGHSFEKFENETIHTYTYADPNVKIILHQATNTKDVGIRIILNNEIVGSSAVYATNFDGFVNEFIMKCGFIIFLNNKNISQY